MGQVSASSSIDVTADPQRTLAAIADYDTVRPRILTSHYRDYKVVEGGKGAGTVAEWTLQATEKRSRNVHAVVSVSDSIVTERDSNSTLVNTWTVTPEGAGARVTLRTTWKGAGGVAGIFEGIFAPLGLKKIQAEVLANLQRELARSQDRGAARRAPRRRRTGQ
ncbi:SRPBCC family protein [Nocardia abscessus]|uniref:SRPBCC family protein n=2 Tax=Nocardiaceae TaxID=85025 RepID=UPI002453A93D|nr:SRPBCC family protein [Nocardia abscessus]